MNLSVGAHTALLYQRLCIRARALAVPKNQQKNLGFSPCGLGKDAAAKALGYRCVAARLKPCPDTKPAQFPLPCRTPSARARDGEMGSGADLEDTGQAESIPQRYREERGALARRYVDAEVAAAANWELVVVQIDLMLPPAFMNIVADASATNASRRVYSIRSCPPSSRQKARIETSNSSNRFCIASRLKSWRPGASVLLLKPRAWMPLPLVLPMLGYGSIHPKIQSLFGLPEIANRWMTMVDQLRLASRL